MNKILYALNDTGRPYTRFFSGGAKINFIKKEGERRIKIFYGDVYLQFVTFNYILTSLITLNIRIATCFFLTFTNTGHYVKISDRNSSWE